MEEVLHQYEQPYDPAWPLICFDERPCFLIEEKGTILPMSPGKTRRHHYEYKKNGACCVLLAFEPHTGLRYVEVRDQRTALNYAEFMHTLLEVYYPTADGIRLVQDNLNTHKPGSFYQVLPSDQAFAMAQRFDMHYTPVNGSWLNMAEIFIDADHDYRTYAHVIVNSLGTYHDKYLDRGVEGYGDRELGWEGVSAAAAAVAYTFWSAEVEFPIANLPDIGTTPSAIWGFNVVRIGNADEYGQWTPTYGDAHSPQSFGFLIFD